MKKISLIFCFICISFNVWSFPIPKDGKVTFDIIRKNKNIGNVTSIFTKKDDKLIIHTVVDIKVKILLFPAYKFFQETTETWQNGELIEIDGFTDFEDEREYYIKGNVTKDKFIATGMDGKLELDKSIISLNYWNKDVLNRKIVFDTQKGIPRKINVEKLSNEIIYLNDHEIYAEKYKLNASKNPKDLGPFPEYTLWYSDDELIKFEFRNWKDKKNIITTIRNDWKK